MEKLDLYRCEICGNLVELIIPGGGELVCCGQPMQKVNGQNKEDAIFEKHIPIFIKNENNGDEVRVGEVLHPMTDEHYIMFIETISEIETMYNFNIYIRARNPKCCCNKN